MSGIYFGGRSNHGGNNLLRNHYCPSEFTRYTNKYPWDFENPRDIAMQ